MTTPAKKAAAPRAAAAKTTVRPVARTAAAKTTARPVARTVAAKPAAAKAPARTAAAKTVEVAAPVYNFTKPYKMLTGLDDGAFCDKVSAHLNAGYKLSGSATMTTVGARIFVGQAVYKHSNLAKAKPKAKAKKKK